MCWPVRSLTSLFCLYPIGPICNSNIKSINIAGVPRSGLTGDTIVKPEDIIYRNGDSDTMESCTDDEGESVALQSKEIKLLRQQMGGLESMYSEVLKLIGLDKDYIPESRRSIASSVSSVSRRGSRFKYSSHQTHRQNKKEFRYDPIMPVYKHLYKAI